MNVRKILWIIIGFILLPIALAAGFLFFGIIALIVLVVFVLIVVLSIVVYLNGRFKQMLYHIQTRRVQYTKRRAHEKKTYKRESRGEEEIVIDEIEEMVEKK